MTRSPGPDITGLLRRIHAHDPDALGELLSQLYDELRDMAMGLLNQEPAGHTLQATALLHKALRRLLDSGTLAKAEDRRFLFAAVYKAMCRVLVDHARRRLALNRGGASQRVPLDDVLDQLTAHWKLSDLDLIAIHEALE